MKINPEVRYIWTSDNLRLQGMHYASEKKDICLLFVHGMFGNFIENYFAPVLGETAAKNNIGFLYGHNRGYGHINDIPIKGKNKDGEYKTKKIGVVYERFADCIYDIDAWLDDIRKLEYKRIVIAGHSLGSPKVICHWYYQKPKDVLGIILASPGDMVGLIKKYQENPPYETLLAEAKKNVLENNPRKLLSGQTWEWYALSSQTFLDLFEENGPADILPILQNPESFPELASIDVPMLCTLGEFDDVVIRSLDEDLALLKSKAAFCPAFLTKIIPGANHNYENQEEVFAKTLIDWIKKL